MISSFSAVTYLLLRATNILAPSSTLRAEHCGEQQSNAYILALIYNCIPGIRIPPLGAYGVWNQIRLGYGKGSYGGGGFFVFFFVFVFICCRVCMPAGETAVGGCGFCFCVSADISFHTQHGGGSSLLLSHCGPRLACLARRYFLFFFLVPCF